MFLKKSRIFHWQLDGGIRLKLIANTEHDLVKVLNTNENGQIMTKLTVLETLPRKESVCNTCVHLIELEKSYFCGLLGAFLSEKILDIPGEFKENTEQ